tara:strand:+ start:1971 stop:2156 length:186 start_codon:yes stop_codon:yes gene_type:complete
MKCKSCDRLLLDDEDIELCRKCLKQDVQFYDDDDDSIDEDEMLDDDVEPYTENKVYNYLLM